MSVLFGESRDNYRPIILDNNNRIEHSISVSEFWIHSCPIVRRDNTCIIYSAKMVCIVQSDSDSTSPTSSPSRPRGMEKRKSSTKGKMAKELQALKSLVPKAKTSDLGDLEVVLEAISYIRKLEDSLRDHSSPALLKAQFIAVERMAAKQCEA